MFFYIPLLVTVWQAIIWPGWQRVSEREVHRGPYFVKPLYMYQLLVQHEHGGEHDGKMMQLILMAHCDVATNGDDSR
jgi:hypothetical protein